MPQTTVVFILALLMGIQPITTDLYLPALPALTEAFGASAAQGQLTLSALLLAFGVSQLVWGPLSDRFGRKPILVIGLTLYILAATGSAFAGAMNHLITWRIMQGLAMGAVVMCGRALVRDLYVPADGMRVMSKGLSGLGVLACISAPIGGYLSGQWGATAALLALVVFGVLTLGIVLTTFRETIPQKNPLALEPVSLVKTWLLIVKNPIFLTYSALSCASYGVLFTFLATSSFVFIKVHGFTPPQYGLIMFGMSAFYLTGTILCRRLLSRLGIKRTVAIAGALSLAGGCLMGGLALAGWHSPWAQIVPFYIIGIGHGIHQPCGQTGAIGPFGKAAGTASALNGFAMMMTAFITGMWLSFAFVGSVRPMILTICFWAACLSIVAWTAVQRNEA
jgi:MFS transporter, DHA1 family, multidrug resistance protein